MSSMFFLTLIIVFVSGLIAYIGDWIGRKMGRKRLSLFGLRPRYTAIVISIGMGMLIAALTLTATFAVNKHVREAFYPHRTSARRVDFFTSRIVYAHRNGPRQPGQNSIPKPMNCRTSK